MAKKTKKVEKKVRRSDGTYDVVIVEVPDTSSDYGSSSDSGSSCDTSSVSVDPGC